MLLTCFDSSTTWTFRFRCKSLCFTDNIYYKYYIILYIYYILKYYNTIYNIRNTMA